RPVDLFPTWSTSPVIRRMDRTTLSQVSLEDHDACPLYFFNQCASIVEVFRFQRNRLYSCVDVSPQGNYLSAVFKPVPGKCLGNQRNIDIAVTVGCSFCMRAEDEGLRNMNSMFLKLFDIFPHHAGYF